MGGLAVLLSISIYLLAAYWVVRKFKASRFKWLVVAAMVLLPTGDSIVGRLYLKYLCDKEGGLKVYRVEEQVAGFMEQLGTDYWVRDGGYQFTESYPTHGRVTRYTKENGQILRQDNVEPKSQYRVSSLHIGDTTNIYLKNQFIVDTVKGEVLATDTQIAFNGGWVERFLAQFSDAGGGAVAWCTNTELNPVKRHRRLVASTLKH